MSSAPAATEVVALLQLIGRHASPQPAAALARELGLPRSTTYRLLGVLRDAGLVTHAENDQRWGLGPAAYELGSAYSRQAPLQRISRPVLARLIDATTHNAHLAILHGRDVLYVIEERAPRRPSLVTDVGVRLPASLTASGLAMLAALPSQQVRALFPSRDSFVQRQGRGPASLTALQSELAQVRRRGYAVESDSVTAGFASFAAAVLDHNALPVAGIAVTYPHADTRETAPLAEAVVAAAAEVSTRLGHRPTARAT